MNAKAEVGDGVCILSFDNGGPGTYSQLLLVKEYMHRISTDLGVNEDDVYPADYFDLIGGVGFGGLVAIMLGHFRMNIDQAIDSLLTISSTVFPEEPTGTSDRAQNSQNLKKSIEGMLEDMDVPLDTKMCDQRRPAGKCKVALYAAASANLSHARAFRTYISRSSSLNPTIVEAICATMSLPTLFLPTKIGARVRQQQFVGGALGTSNPTRELLTEAATIFGKDTRVAQIISIGAGMPTVVSLDPSGQTESIDQLLHALETDCEVVAKELSTRLFAVDAYLRLNVERGMERMVMTDWSPLGAIESHTSSYVESTAVTEALESSLGRLRSRTGSITLGQLSRASTIKITAKEAPAVSPYYVVRKLPWDIMVHHLVNTSHSRQKIFPITGMGGCGKTQMVSYFLQEYRSLYKNVIYVDASSSSSIKGDLQTWSRSFGDKHEHDTWEDGLQTLTSASGNDYHILVLDNADDPALNLIPYLPKGKNVTIIITSRNNALGRLSTTHHLELAEMESDEALSTLTQAARRQSQLSSEEEASALTLINELGHLAVALVQAGSYCSELSSTIGGIFQPYSFTQYLSLFRAHRSELMKKSENSTLDNYQRGAYTAFDLSYNAAPETARQFVHFISFFHHTDISLDALSTAAEHSFKDEGNNYLTRPKTHKNSIHVLESLLCTNGKWNELRVQDIVRILRSFSLISITSVQDTVLLQLHPLVQSWLRDKESPDSRLYEEMAAQILTSCCREDNFRLHRYLLPHVLDILPRVESFHVNDRVSAGKILYWQGDYQRAIVLFKNAEESLKLAEGAKEINRLAVGERLSRAYRYAGKLSEAEKLDVEILERRRVILGMEHPTTLTAAANLVSTYASQGRLEEAEKLGVEVLEQRRKTLGVDHPQTLVSSANLAFTYGSQGRWDEAEKLDIEVLEQRQRILGMEHPDTIRAATNLATTYSGQSRWDDVARVLEPAMIYGLNILGREHRHTQTCVRRLEEAYMKLGRKEEADTTRLLLITRDA